MLPANISRSRLISVFARTRGAAVLTLLGLGVLHADSSAQSTWYVDASATTPGNGSASMPYQKIDFALAQPNVISGDTLSVAAGDYLHEAIDYLGKDVLVESVAGSGATFITGDYALNFGLNQLPLVRFVSGEGPGAILRGFTLRGIDDITTFPDAPVVCDQSAPRIEDCIWTDCTGLGVAGALYVNGGSPVLSNCDVGRADKACFVTSGNLTIEDTEFYSSADFSVKAESSILVMERCRLRSSGHQLFQASDGAALYANGSDVTIRDCIFDGVYANGFVGPRHMTLWNCTSVVSGSTFQRGNAQLDWNLMHEGGSVLFSGSLQITDCLFRRNIGSNGGVINGSGIFSATDCVFENNDGAWEGGTGGALTLSGTVTLEGCEFRENTASQGGAVFLHGIGTDVIVRDCLFGDNRASSTSWDNFTIRGGAICANDILSLSVLDSRFLGNSSFGGLAWTVGGILDGEGGAIYSTSSFTTISDCVFRNNTATSDEAAKGGALFLLGSARVFKTLFANNLTQGALNHDGAAVWGYADFVKSTIYNGDFDDHAILQGHLTGCIAAGTDALALAVTSAHTLTDEPWPGLGNLSGDAGFWNESGEGDFHLLPGSQAIDAFGPGFPDPDGSLADMGCYPYSPDYCGPDCTGTISTQTCAGNFNSTGQPAIAEAWGSDSILDGDLVLGVKSLPQGKYGYFLSSRIGAFVPNFGGSMGNLCIGGFFVRHHDAVLLPNSPGRVGVRRELSALVRGMLLSGDTVHFQYWYRDSVAGQSVSNTSSGISVVFQD